MRAVSALLGIVAMAGIAASQANRSVWDGVYSPEQAKRGQARYNEKCASCHGSTLEGGESAPPLAGSDFLSTWGGLTVGDLFDRTRATMPQDNPGTLTRSANAEILAYIFSANQFPAGKTELPQAGDDLKQIKIQANKTDAKE
jgi:mono/diheme cytochrome c family protein